jgi:hypothetical protein
MATAMKVTVSPERISLRPGESADIEVTVQNASQVVEHFAASVVGLPSNDLWSCEPDVVKLRPREVGTLRLKIEVPERGGLVAGPYILGLVVKSPYSQEVSRCEELPLDVQPAPALTMTAQPEVVTGGKVGHYAVNLANEGNMPMAVTLSGSDPENRVGFKFEPKELRLEPGMAAGAQITVNSDPPLTGQEIRRMMTLRAHSGDTVAEKPLTFVQRPRIRGGMMKFGALAAGLAVLGGMTYGGAKVLRDIKTTQDANSAPLPQVPATNNQGDPNKNQNGQTSAAPTPPPASTPPSQAQTQAPPPPPPPSNSAAPGNPPPVPVEGNQFIDFTQDIDGQPARTGTVDRTHWRDQNLMLNNVTDQAPAFCKDATAQGIRVASPGVQGNPVSGAGAYLTSSFPTDLQECNIVPIRMTFPVPLTAVNVYFTALPGVKYTATATFADGNTQTLDAAGTKIGEQVPLGFAMKQGGKPIMSVVFGRHASVEPGPGSVSMLKRLTFTRTQ